jgi:hypothetical protein
MAHPARHVFSAFYLAAIRQVVILRGTLNRCTYGIQSYFIYFYS